VLADALGVAALDRLPSPLPPVLVNCTPLGGAKALRESPVSADSLSDVHAVCDLAYRPDAAPTVLCRDAAERGLAVVDGIEVLVRQGARSFAIWTGVEPDLDVMRGALRE
jgi:shikimate dehydrogenase